nr:glycine-rich protein 1-like [Aegilops tauschii subsp. strangulata]
MRSRAHPCGAEPDREGEARPPGSGGDWPAWATTSGSNDQRGWTRAVPHGGGERNGGRRRPLQAVCGDGEQGAGRRASVEEGAVTVALVVASASEVPVRAAEHGDAGAARAGCSAGGRVRPGAGGHGVGHGGRRSTGGEGKRGPRASPYSVGTMAAGLGKEVEDDGDGEDGDEVSGRRRCSSDDGVQRRRRR